MTFLIDLFFYLLFIYLFIYINKKEWWFFLDYYLLFYDDQKIHYAQIEKEKKTSIFLNQLFFSSLFGGGMRPDPSSINVNKDF